jgi:hypothetical protein
MMGSRIGDEMDDEMRNKMRNKISEISEKMAEEGKPLIELAGLFIKKPLSLEGLLMLEDKGPITIDQVYKEFTGYVGEDINVTCMLDELKGFGIIAIKDNIVSVTDRGKCIVMKLRIEMNNFGEGVVKSCDIKQDCILDVDSRKL